MFNFLSKLVCRVRVVLHIRSEFLVGHLRIVRGLVVRVTALTRLETLESSLASLEHKAAVRSLGQFLDLVGQSLNGAICVQLSLIQVEQSLNGFYVLRFCRRQSQLNGGIDFEAFDLSLMGLRRSCVLGLESCDLVFQSFNVAGRGLEGLQLLVALLNRVGKVFLLSVQRCLLYTSPSPRDLSTSRMPSSA